VHARLLAETESACALKMAARHFTSTAVFFVTMWHNSFKLATALRLAYIHPQVGEDSSAHLV
jgi:hypothetical protein